MYAHTHMYAAQFTGAIDIYWQVLQSDLQLLKHFCL